MRDPRVPDPFLSEVLNKTGNRRRLPTYTFSRTVQHAPIRLSRRPGDEVDKWVSSLRFGDPDPMAPTRCSSAPSLLGPGFYPLDCDLPLDDFDIRATATTRNANRLTALPYAFDKEKRIGEDGALKGLSGMWGGGRRKHDAEPGSYKMVKLGCLSKCCDSPRISFTKADTGRGRVELMTRTGKVSGEPI